MFWYQPGGRGSLSNVSLGLEYLGLEGLGVVGNCLRAYSTPTSIKTHTLLVEWGWGGIYWLTKDLGAEGLAIYWPTTD